MEVDKGSNQKSDILPHWMAAHARLKNEFKEDEKCHYLISWLNYCYKVLVIRVLTPTSTNYHSHISPLWQTVVTEIHSSPVTLWILLTLGSSLLEVFGNVARLLTDVADEKFLDRRVELVLVLQQVEIEGILHFGSAV